MPTNTLAVKVEHLLLLQQWLQTRDFAADGTDINVLALLIEALDATSAVLSHVRYGAEPPAEIISLRYHLGELQQAAYSAVLRAVGSINPTLIADSPDPVSPVYLLFKAQDNGSTDARSALSNLYRQTILRQTAADYSALQQDPVAWAALLEEDALLTGTLQDGLEHDSYPL